MGFGPLLFKSPLVLRVGFIPFRAGGPLGCVGASPS